MKTRELIALFTLVAIFLLSLMKIYDYDVWFHLKAGEYIVSNLTIPTADVFSYTAYGKPWVTHEWLFEVLLYAVSLLLGLPGLALFKAAIITAVFAVYLFHLRREGVSVALSVVVLITAAVLSKERFIARPELVTYLFTALYITSLESFSRGGRTNLHYLIFFPATMLFWANSHSGAVFGLFIIGAYGAGAFADPLLARLPGRRGGRALSLEDSAPRRPRFLLILFLLALGAGLLNPNTYQVYLYPLTALGISAETGLNLFEYRPPSWAFDSYFFIVLALSAVVMLLSFRRLRFAHILLYLLFSWSALKYNRNIALWAMVTLPIVAIYLSAFEAAIARGVGHSPEKKEDLISKTALLLTVAYLLAVAVPSISSSYREGYFGVGVKKGVFPVGAVDFIERTGIDGNIFNSYEFGGYLIWRGYPERRVYVDGRSDVYTELLTEQKELAGRGFEAIIERHSIDYALLSYNPTNVDYINRSPAFIRDLALLWWDDTAMVFLTRKPENAALIEEYEYAYIRPTDLGFDYTDKSEPEKLSAELKRNIALDPGGWRNYLLLSRVYKATGLVDESVLLLEKARANMAVRR